MPFLRTEQKLNYYIFKCLNALFLKGGVLMTVIKPTVMTSSCKQNCKGSCPNTPTANKSTRAK